MAAAAVQIGARFLARGRAANATRSQQSSRFDTANDIYQTVGGPQQAGPQQPQQQHQEGGGFNPALLNAGSAYLYNSSNTGSSGGGGMSFIADLLNAEADRSQRKWEMEQQMQMQSDQLTFDRDKLKAEMDHAKEQLAAQTEQQQRALEYQDQWNEKQFELSNKELDQKHEIDTRIQDREDEKVDAQIDQAEFDRALTLDSTARQNERDDYEFERLRKQNARDDQLIEQDANNAADVAYTFLHNCGNVLKKATFGSYNIIIVHGGRDDDQEQPLQGLVAPLEEVKVRLPNGETRYYRVHLFKQGVYIRNGSQKDDKLWYWPEEAKELGALHHKANGGYGKQHEEDEEELAYDEDEEGEEGEEDEEGEEYEEGEGEGEEEAEEGDGEEEGEEEGEGEGEEEGEGEGEGEEDGEEEEEDEGPVAVNRLPLGLSMVKNPFLLDQGQGEEEDSNLKALDARQNQLSEQRAQADGEDDEEAEEPLRLVFKYKEEVDPAMIQQMVLAMTNDAQVEAQVLAQKINNPGNVTGGVGASGMSLEDEAAGYGQGQYPDESYADPGYEQDQYPDESYADPSNMAGGVDASGMSLEDEAAGYGQGQYPDESYADPGYEQDQYPDESYADPSNMAGGVDASGMGLEDEAAGYGQGQYPEESYANPGNVTAGVGASGMSLEDEAAGYDQGQLQDQSYADRDAQYQYEQQLQDYYGGQGAVAGADPATEVVPEATEAAAQPAPAVAALPALGTPLPPGMTSPADTLQGGTPSAMANAPNGVGIDQALNPISANDSYQAPGQYGSARDMQQFQPSQANPMMHMGNGGSSGGGTSSAIMQAGASYLGSKAAARG